MINAFITVTREQALAAAREAEAELRHAYEQATEWHTRRPLLS